MADEPEEIEVETPEIETPEVVEPPKPVDPDEGIEALKANLDAATAKLAEANAGRAEAERRARDANKTASERAQETADTNLALVTNAIDGVKKDKETLKANYSAAAAAGDWDAAAEAQEGMAEAAAKLQTLEQGKVALEAEAKAPKIQQVDDPVEVLALQLSPRSATWVRSHPEYAREPRLYQKMLAAHNLAMTDDIEADSDAYFEAIETTLKMRKVPVVAPVGEVLSEAAAPRRETPPAAAPASRGNGTERTVRLTSAQVEMAKATGLTNEEYAAQLVRARANGEIQ